MTTALPCFALTEPDASVTNHDGTPYDGSLRSDELPDALTDDERAATLRNENSEEKKECRLLSRKYARPLMDPDKNPEKVATQKCDARKQKAKDNLRAKADGLIAKINAGDSVKTSCDSLKELYDETESQMDQAITRNGDDATDDETTSPDKSCNYRFTDCGQDLQKYQSRFGRNLRSMCPDAENTFQLMDQRSQNCRNRLNAERDQLKTDLDEIAKTKAVPAKCGQIARSGDDDEGSGKKGKGKDGGGGDGKGGDKKDDKKQAGGGGGSGMPQMPQSPQQEQPQQPQNQQAQELNDDSCYKPGNESKPACMCMLTGNCRNGDAKEVAALAPVPGVGGAALTKGSSSPSLGNMGPQFPGNAENGQGGMFAAAAGAGGGGGGGPSGGGGGRPEAPPAKPKARSALGADILQGVRGGSGSRGGRTHPGFSVPAFEGGSRSNTVDVSKFVPDSRMPASLADAIPVDISAMGSGNAHLHPSNANLFNEVSRQYHKQQSTLDTEK